MIANKQTQESREHQTLDSRHALKNEIESSDFNSYEVDILSQFKANLNQLDELQARFRFILHEVSGLLTKK